jgi:hypothetical protein
LGASSSSGTLGVSNSIDTQISSRMDPSSLLRKKPSSTLATTSASTCIIHVLALGKLTKKRKKEAHIKKTFKNECDVEFP